MNADAYERLENQKIEIERLRATLWEIRRDIIECADDVVWMRGGIETVVDRINAVIGENWEPGTSAKQA